MPGEADRPGVVYQVLASHGGDYWQVQVRDCRTRGEAERVMRALIRKRYTDAPYWAIDEVSRNRVTFPRSEARKVSPTPSEWVA